MSPRTRLLEILNAADLAKIQDAQAATQAQANAANTVQWTGLLKSLPSVLGTGIDAYQKSAADDADTAAKQAIADNAGATGEHPLLPGAEYGAQPDMRDPTKYAGTAGDVAKAATESNPALNPPKPKGIFDNVLSILGDKEGAAAKARANASTGIASEVQKNRDSATAQQRQQDLDALNAKNVQSEIGGRDFEQGRQKSLDVYTKQDRARALIPGLVAGGVANGEAPDDLAKRIAQMPGMDALSPDEINTYVLGEHQKQASARMDEGAAREVNAQKAADAHAEAVAKAALMGREHVPGAGKNPNGKAMQPEMLDKFVSSPRALISKLDDLGAMKIPDDATGLKGGAADYVEQHVPVVGNMASQVIAPGRNDVVTKVVDAVVAANNAMDRKTTRESMQIWDKQLRGALAKGPDAFKTAVDDIKADLVKAQTARESNLRASGFNVPGTMPTTTAPLDLSSMSADDLAKLSDDDLRKLAGGG